MKLGFFAYFFIFAILLCGGGFLYLALSPMPVTQQEIVVDIPLEAAR